MDSTIQLHYVLYLKNRILYMLAWIAQDACAVGASDLSRALAPVEAFITSDLARIIMLSGCGMYAWRAWSEGNPMGLVGAGAIALGAQSLFHYVKDAHPIVWDAVCALY